MTVSSRLFVISMIAVAMPARAHMLGGGGRPSSSGGGSSGNAWNQLDPVPSDQNGGAKSPEQAALEAQLQKMKAYCDTVDASAKESCYGALKMSAAAIDSVKKGLDAQASQNATPASGSSGPRSKLDRERGAEAERLKTARARCDALDGLDAEACYEEMRATHEAWHEKYEPMKGLSELPDFKKMREARAKCLKLKDPKKRRQCLKDLVKKKLRKTSSEPTSSEGK